MAITLARSLRAELEEFKARCRDQQASSCGPTCWNYNVNDNVIAIETRLAAARGKLTVVCRWRLNGRALGWNALLGALRTKGLLDEVV